MRLIDRYVLQDELARGGMGTVHLGQMIGPGGFSRTVAIKRLHGHLAELPEARAMFLDEARISARIGHRNVVSIIDIVEHEKELFLVMDYVHGIPLSILAERAKKKGETLPLGVIVSLVLEVLDGLQAAHDATTEQGAPLGIVHRDISPQNVMVGADGMARVVDFGIAKAAMRSQTTRDGQIKGKLRYMAPEQFLEEEVDPRTDVYAASVVLWELLTGTPLFASSSEGAVVAKVLEGVIVPPSRLRGDLPPAWDAVVLRGLARSPTDRFSSAREMASKIRELFVPAPAHEVAEVVEQLAGDLIRDRAQRVASIDTASLKKNAADAPELTLRPSDLATQTMAAKLPPVLARTRPRSRAPWLIGGVAALSATLAMGLLATRHRESPHEVAPRAVVSVSETASSEVTTPSALPPNVESVPSVSSAPTAILQVKREPIHRPLRPKGDPHPATSSSRPGCSPMFMIDANGIRRIKPECL